MKLSSDLAILPVFIGISLSCLAGSAQAQTVVDREIVFLIDSSGSISRTDFDLQIGAYRDIFANPNFFNTYVAPLPNQKIAVGALQFGSSVDEIAPLTLIDSQEDAIAFANLFNNVSKGGGGTNMTDAIIQGTSVLTSNTFEGFKVIDISTDGNPSSQSSATQASVDSIAAGVNVINAIGVGSGVDINFLQNNIARGTNSNGSAAFVLEADNFDEFQATLDQKFAREVGPPSVIPEPSTVIGLLSVSAFGIGRVLKRKQKSRLNIAQLNAK